MADRPTPVLETHCGNMPDPRMERNQRHRLVDILVIAVCGVRCGAETWVDIELFGQSKVGWLRGFLDLPNGIPAHDPFGRVFARSDPKAFQTCFLQWVQAEVSLREARVIAIDGTTVRGSQDRINDRNPLHMVSAWATEHRLVLAQLATDDKSNDITAIPLVLKALDIRA